MKIGILGQNNTEVYVAETGCNYCDWTELDWLSVVIKWNVVIKFVNFLSRGVLPEVKMSMVVFRR